jgi:2-polyprenyl-6-methoxyphenol hydroxylase-like FAD-dependent oxidoreductase
MKARVGIISAGPGGLILVRLLQREGVDVSVFERDASPNARFSGGSLDMAASSGRKAIRAAGLDAAFRQLARPESDAYTISDETGRITFRVPARRFISQRPEIDRAQLRTMLLSSLALPTVQWGRRFVVLSDANARKRIHFEEGPTTDVDLVVGADGTRSHVRPFVTGQAPEYSGVTLLQGDIAEPARDCPAILDWVRGANFFALGRSIGVLVQARSSGALSLYISQKVPEEDDLSGIDLSSKDAVRAYTGEILRGWHPAIVEAVEVSAPLSVKPLVRTAVNQSWPHKPNITLIGDAAHVMPPFGGEGANMGMLDALLLAKALLDSGDDIATALVQYEQEMLVRTGGVQRATTALQEIFNAPNAAELLPRAFMGRLAFLAPFIPGAVSAMNFLLPKRTAAR